MFVGQNTSKPLWVIFEDGGENSWTEIALSKLISPHPYPAPRQTVVHNDSINYNTHHYTDSKTQNTILVLLVLLVCDGNKTNSTTKQAMATLYQVGCAYLLWRHRLCGTTCLRALTSGTWRDYFGALGSQSRDIFAGIIFQYKMHRKKRNEFVFEDSNVRGF